MHTWFTSRTSSAWVISVNGCHGCRSERSLWSPIVYRRRNFWSVMSGSLHSRDMCAVPDEGDRCLCAAAALQFPYGGYLSKPAIHGPSGFLFLAQFHSKPFSIIIHCAFTLNFHRTANDWGRHKCFSSTVSISSELLLCRTIQTLCVVKYSNCAHCLFAGDNRQFPDPRKHSMSIYPAINDD